jgi:hypothetical protein
MNQKEINPIDKDFVEKYILWLDNNGYRRRGDDLYLKYNKFMKEMSKKGPPYLKISDNLKRDFYKKRFQIKCYKYFFRETHPSKYNYNQFRRFYDSHSVGQPPMHFEFRMELKKYIDSMSLKELIIYKRWELLQKIIEHDKICLPKDLIDEIQDNADEIEYM